MHRKNSIIKREKMSERAHPEDPGFIDTPTWSSPYKKNLFERYIFAQQYIVNKIILDVPCGTGWGTSLLRDYSYCCGIDISSEAIMYANKHFRTHNCEFFVGDMVKMDFEKNQFDVIVCLEGLEHISKTSGVQFINESMRILRGGGVLLLSCPVLNAEGKSSGNPYHIYEYPEDELYKLVCKNFKIKFQKRIICPDGPTYRFVLELQ
jgi:ubiquinone/menaquinone biosynthesis C-methylase UbiE